MSLIPSSSTPRHNAVHARILVLVAIAAAVIALTSADGARKAPPTLHASMPMSEAAMANMLGDWYAKHPAHGQASTDVAADTFLVSNTIFDADGKLATQVDTVRIMTGQTVLWLWVNGFHTTTSGEGSADPNAGYWWDGPLDSADKSFAYTFTSAGTYPFFCQFHEIFNMKGVVVVSDPVTPVAPRTWGGLKTQYRK